MVIELTSEREQWIKGIFITKGPILRSKDLRSFKVNSRDVQELMAQEKLFRFKEGYYAWHDQAHLLSDARIATAVIPGATLFYLSAASYYGLITLIPDRVYVAVHNRGIEPTKPDHPPIDISRLSKNLYHLGKIGIREEKGSVLPIYDREKTLCDIAKRMDEAGKDVLLEAVRNYMNGPKKLQTLYEYAGTMRVYQRIHPYIEAHV